MAIEVYVQARMGSTRLPGKVLKKVLHEPLLHYLVERLRQSKEADGFAILTTDKPIDDQIASFCEREKVPCIRGDQDDVLARYHQAALARTPEAIVRITGDCPLIDPRLIDQAISLYRANSDTDLVTNVLERTYPRGMDVELFSTTTLRKLFQTVTNRAEREHVTLHLYRHPELFKIKDFQHVENLSHYRLTVDTEEDFALIKLILEALQPANPHYSMDEIIKLLKQHPEWCQINAHIKQKSQ